MVGWGWEGEGVGAAARVGASGGTGACIGTVAIYHVRAGGGKTDSVEWRHL